MRYTRLWIGLTVVIVGSFAILGYYGFEIYRQAPPRPERVVTAEGAVIFTGQQIKDGQNVWQSMGGQEVGSIWGHGAYVAPIGPPTGCIAKRFGFWTAGRRKSLAKRSTNWTKNAQRLSKPACRKNFARTPTTRKRRT